MRHVLRLAAVLAVVVAALTAASTASAAEGAFVGHGCLLGPPPGTEGHGGVVIV